MKRPRLLPYQLLLLGLGLLVCLTAQTPRPAGNLEQKLRSSRWKKRLLLIAAPTAGHADFRRQKALLVASQAELAERDFLVLDVLYDQLSAADRRFLARQTGLEPPHFAAVLIGKDGEVKLRSARPLPPAALFATVDQIPKRRQEMRRATAAEPGARP